MPDSTYHRMMASNRKPLVWLRGEVKTPPFTTAGRVEAGTLLRRLQDGESLSLPHSRPMPSIGTNCHEIRVRDAGHHWRIVYHLAEDAIIILDVFAKTTPRTPRTVIADCQRRLRLYRQSRSA
jgi:phage-related protein